MDFMDVQCKQIDNAIRRCFIAPWKCLLKPNQFFDYTMVSTMITLVAQNPGASLRDGNIQNFYSNIIQVEKSDAGFRGLFRGGTQIHGNVDQKSLLNVSIGHMYKGNHFQTFPAQRITRDIVLKEYREVTEYVMQSEEIVKASALEDFMGYCKQEDYSNLPKDMVDFLCKEVRSMDM